MPGDNFPDDKAMVIGYQQLVIYTLINNQLIFA
jgi:hypothetical protein